MRLNVTIKRSGPTFPAIVKQELYTLSLAINRTLEEAQTAQRQSMASNFIDRRGGFLARMVKIAPSDRATRDNPIGRLRIVGPEGAEDRAQILTRHEDGGTRSAGGVGYSIDPSVRIGGFFYVPTEAIRSPFSATVPRKLYPSSLHITERRDVTGINPAHVHRTASGALQLKGDNRTFVLFGANGGPPIGIFQRDGAKKFGGRGHSAGRTTHFAAGGNVTRDDIRLIWAFDRSVTLKPRLHFYEVVPNTVRDRLLVNFFGFLPGALATAK